MFGGSSFLESSDQWGVGDDGHRHPISSPTFCMLLFLAKALSTGLTIG